MKSADDVYVWIYKKFDYLQPVPDAATQQSFETLLTRSFSQIFLFLFLFRVAGFSLIPASRQEIANAAKHIVNLAARETEATVLVVGEADSSKFHLIIPRKPPNHRQ